jgi:prevent-host-death family protein
MIDLATDINSLTSFKRKTTDLVEQLKSSGRPMVLTVNGKAEVVVQDASAYQRLLDLLEEAHAITSIDEGLRQMRAGKGQPAKKALASLRSKLRLPENK